MKDFWEYFGGLFITIAVVAIIAISCCWYSASRKARIFNTNFGTNYTTGDFFWTESTIKNYIHQGEQKKVNLDFIE